MAKQTKTLPVTKAVFARRAAVTPPLIGRHVLVSASISVLSLIQFGTAHAQAAQLAPDAVFACSDLIGSVFDDKDKDGYQDENEPGMAGVRLATAEGLLVTTDHNGRFHITCAAVPNSQIGSNFILKLDERTLPSGYNLTSENPRVVRLTRGRLSKANFATALENIVDLEVTDAAFELDGTRLKPEFAGQLGQLVDALKGQESATLRLTYLATENSDKSRMYELSDQIQDLWDASGGKHNLNIERKTIWFDERLTAKRT